MVGSEGARAAGGRGVKDWVGLPPGPDRVQRDRRGKAFVRHIGQQLVTGEAHSSGTKDAGMLVNKTV